MLNQLLSQSECHLRGSENKNNYNFVRHFIFFVLTAVVDH